MQCAYCQSHAVVKNGKYNLKDGRAVQHHLCKNCVKRFSAKTGTTMARLRTLVELVGMVLKMRSEGLGVRASGRVLDKYHSAILRWEGRVAGQEDSWSPPAPTNSEVSLDNDELYTRVGENVPPPINQSAGP